MREKTVVMIAMISFLFPAQAAIAADPTMGTWELNVARSHCQPYQTIKSQVMVMTPHEDGFKHVSNGVTASGTPLHVEFTGRFDGRDYPIKGYPGADTITSTKIDENTYLFVFKKESKEISTMRSVFSGKNKILTVTQKMKSPQGEDITSTWVYNKK
jgi:hypothetical protein